MAELINMPRLSDTMEEGVVAKWLKKVGDKVSEGDILAEIETDKATMEFESFYEGTLLHIGLDEGETAPVDTLLAIIGEKDEDISDLIKGKEKDSDKKEEKDSGKEKSDKKDSDAKEEKSETDEESDDDSKENESSSNTDIPEDVEVITMPRLSDTMTEGTVATWLKKEGDEVSEGDILAEIETDKATMEFESFYTGTLLKIGIGEGESAPVDSILAILGPKGTDVSELMENLKISEGKKQTTTKPSEEKTEAKAPEQSESKSSESKQVSTQTSSSGGRIFASPLAKKMAEEKGINLSQVNGSGENGRIVKKDIENYQPGAGSQSYTPVGEEQFEEVKNSQMRKTIAKRLGESKFTAPHYYLTIDLDMDNAIASRAAINEMNEGKISFNDMIVKASAMALRKHPRVNSQWKGDTTMIAKHIHIGVAVAVDEGLVVPVLKFADQMSFSQIGINVKELAVKARDKKLKPEEMEGSTFTVSNLGMFGIREFTSIINQPNSAILSVGAIVQKPVVKNGQIAVGNVMTVTLACDHRTVDGATGSAYLQTLKQFIENPVTMFV
ncbi:pyruvate dehydrogenase complex dihydrolipoamide acetyltransferase [Planktosalinus lacus]|uniref:Acetyltransferase component of pyruvate dehydrogenase complex n=1 Tax=Planktosalinus lacus TaxID=1526573 RepID=A0A8J2V8H4_9FLAO|nr:pyruvate dehydrogenase complex dihydrolipoamide acetyltransferase [Planktosalinus lacus]GGD87015.1 dihydrolipoamide acetyltransferase component of pyruvate dehydrogenase complex [Planktosalinus lacus]